jgi:NADPH:quinone reductase-like Zn-dependent oxidoreductase
MPSTQKALLVTAVGQPITLTQDRLVPQPGPDQVQIKVSVAGLNPHDQKSRDTGLFIAEHLPAVLANDVVGKVSAVGSNVTNFKVGDRVVSHAGIAAASTQNGLQEYAVADTECTVRIPDAFSDDDAATLPTNIIAPLVGLFDKTALDLPAPWTEEANSFDFASTSILIIGGGSNCGRFAVQLAKLAGIGKIVVVGGKEAEMKQFGATDIIDRHAPEEEILKQIRAVVGDGLIYSFDAVNGPEGQIMGLNALSSSMKGKFARLLPRPVDETKVVGKNAGFEIKNVFGSSQLRPEVCKPFWKLVPQYLEEGKIIPLQYVVEKGLDAAKVNEVLDRYRDGKPVTKTHFHI